MRAHYLLTAFLFVAAAGQSLESFAVETNTEKLEAARNKSTDAVKRTYRNAKDEVCELINGKEKCIVKKAVNKVKSTADTIETTAEEMKDKAD